MLKKFVVLIALSSPFVTALAESKANESICQKEMKWISEQPLRVQEYTILNASGKIFEKFIEVNSRKNATSEDRLWGYKILAGGNYLLKEYPIESPRVNSITSGFSLSATQMIRGAIKLQEFKSQINPLIQQAEAIDKDVYAEKITLPEKDKRGVDAAYKCVLVAAMISASSKD